jgi:hypothetical protein
MDVARFFYNKLNQLEKAIFQNPFKEYYDSLSAVYAAKSVLFLIVFNRLKTEHTINYPAEFVSSEILYNFDQHITLNYQCFK